MEHQHEAKEKRKQNYERNREKLLADGKKYYQNNKDARKAYYQNNRETRLNYANERYRKLKANNVGTTKQSAVGTHEV